MEVVGWARGFAMIESANMPINKINKRHRDATAWS